MAKVLKCDGNLSIVDAIHIISPLYPQIGAYLFKKFIFILLSQNLIQNSNQHRLLIVWILYKHNCLNFDCYIRKLDNNESAGKIEDLYDKYIQVTGTQINTVSCSNIDKPLPYKVTWYINLGLSYMAIIQYVRNRT